MALSTASSRSAASRLTIQLRIALVSVVFVLSLVLIGIASWTGSGQLTAAFEDSRAYSALAARSREVRAASFALKALSRDVRFRQEATDLKDFGTGLESLKQAIAHLGSAAGADRVRDSIVALDAPMKAIEADFTAIGTMQLALRSAAPEGLAARLEDAAEALETKVRSHSMGADSPDLARLPGILAALRRIDAAYRLSLDESLLGQWEVEQGRFERALGRQGIPAEARGEIEPAFKAYAEIVPPGARPRRTSCSPAKNSPASST